MRCFCSVINQFTGFSLAGARLSLPTKWTAMKQDEDFRVVYIDSKTAEYKEIEKEFINQVNTGPYASKIPNKQNIKVVKVCGEIHYLN